MSPYVTKPMVIGTPFGSGSPTGRLLEDKPAAQRYVSLLSSLQQIRRDGPEGALADKVFVEESKALELVSSDFSDIERRIVAHFS